MKKIVGFCMACTFVATTVSASSFQLSASAIDCAFASPVSDVETWELANLFVTKDVHALSGCSSASASLSLENNSFHLIESASTGLAQAGAGISGSFTETFTVDGSGTFLLKPIVHASPSAIGPTSGSSFGNTVGGQYQLGATMDAGSLGSAVSQTIFNTSKTYPGFNQDTQLTLTLPIGTVFDVNFLLTAFTSATSDSFMGASATIDASHTIFFTVIPVTPGASIHSLSGIDYSSVSNEATPTPVPEPATLLLLGSGTIGLLGRRWRDRSRATRAGSDVAEHVTM